MRSHRPIIRVLVPAHHRTRARLLDEKAARPHLEIRSEDAFHEIENLRLHRELEEIRARLVPFADVLRCLARLEQREHLRKLGVDPVHFRTGENRRQAGSHLIMRKDARTIVVPMYKPIKPGTLAGLIAQAGVSVEAFCAEN
ncbi:MAG: hypothetical protein B9S26_09415 [Opitutia bacterium Tous-C4FEB]|nr:MAG: hypothetical protein B9S35_11490 [Opitutae bacterium Tous-C5TDCM]PAW89046.1 MAG: hypothetical protein B9S26_09415 [Opitutae bacterium Tous-C4FEB]